MSAVDGTGAAEGAGAGKGLVVGMGAGGGARRRWTARAVAAAWTAMGGRK